ncbi:MAG TPA: DUF6252 family protein [Candidatus Kapabacteria bacterium]|jgi:hypothetical protein|nr:DUF6252 family protein [Candidatus Kapabacteria bacterium]
MKQVSSKLIGIFAIAIGLFAGCNASTSPNGTTTTPGSMVATINGSSWSSAVVPGGITGGATATRSSSGIVTVTGVSTDFTEITLVLYNPQVGTVSLGTSANLGEYSHGVPDTSSAYLSIPSLTNFNSGSVTITTFDTVNRQISGQFNFIGRKAHDFSDTVNVTNGSFYQVEWSK